jgi:hypothetical protein
MRVDTVKEQLQLNSDYVCAVSKEHGDLQIRFGFKELAFMDDFKTCVSDLTNSRQYGLNGSHLNRDKLP